jgi:hypothetical protein
MPSLCGLWCMRRDFKGYCELHRVSGQRIPTNRNVNSVEPHLLPSDACG